MRILRIDEILDSKSMSLRDFSEITGLSYTYCSEVTRNVKFPRKETLIDIARVLEVDLRDLFVSTMDGPKTADDVLKEINNLSSDYLNRDDKN